MLLESVLINYAFKACGLVISRNYHVISSMQYCLKALYRKCASQIIYIYKISIISYKWEDENRKLLPVFIFPFITYCRCAHRYDYTAICPGRKNFEFDLDLKFNLIYDLIFFWRKEKTFFPQMSKKVLAVNFIDVNYNEKQKFLYYDT